MAATQAIHGLIEVTLAHHRITATRGVVNRIMRCAKRSKNKPNSAVIDAIKLAVIREQRRI